MSIKISHKHHPMKGAIAMMLSGVFFACINLLTELFPHKVGSDIPASVIAFYQYSFALLFFIPYLFKIGIINALKTGNIWWHLLRVICSVIGIQCWIMALVNNVPMGQAIGLLMTSPLFVILGSHFFLKEKISKNRFFATIIGFIGTLFILEPWADNFSWYSVLPLIAAFFWAAFSVIVRKISNSDSPLTMVVYLFVLTSPFNFLKALPHLDSVEISLFGFEYLLFLGFLTALAQYAIAKAYNLADASYVQPFDYFKLPLNILAGWFILNQIPTQGFWLGFVLVIISIIYITKVETKKNNAKLDYDS